MKKFFIFLSVIGVLSAMVFFSLRDQGKKGKAVQVEKAAHRTLRKEIKASGKIQPRTQVNLQSDITAKIVKLFFKEGDWVEKGQKMVQLDDKTVVLQRDQAQASYDIAQADVKMAKAALEEAQLQYERYKKLFSQGLVTQEQLEQAKSALLQRQASLESAKKRLTRAEASLKEAEEKLSKTLLYAPMTGRVVNLAMEEGEVVVMGTTNIPGSVIATLADMQDILAEVDVVESEVTQLKEGMPAEIKVDALPDEVFSGKVNEIAHSASSRGDVNYFKVKIALDKTDPRLRPGMTAKAKILVKEVPQALTVPIQAVVQRDEKSGVFLFSQGKAQWKEVETGLSDIQYVEIIKGLSEKDQVITGPSRILSKLADGDPVMKKKEDESK